MVPVATGFPLLEITAFLQEPAGGSSFHRHPEIKPLNVLLMSREEEERGEGVGGYVRPAPHLAVHDISASLTSAGGEPF